MSHLSLHCNIVPASEKELVLDFWGNTASLSYDAFKQIKPLLLNL